MIIDLILKWLNYLLLHSSTTVNNENEPISTASKSSQDDPTSSTSSEITTIDSSRVHSKLLHRRIVTMLETLRRRVEIVELLHHTKLTSSHTESKSQPITFGQLRQATQYHLHLLHQSLKKINFITFEYDLYQRIHSYNNLTYIYTR